MEDVSPKISVLLPVYNAELYLREAIDSILNQTFKDFEFILVDDGSTDQSLEIIQSYSDNRIIVIKNSHNLGIIESLNKGIELSRGRYIARMDADDISERERLSLQYDYMESNHDLAVIGSWYRHFPDNYVVKLPEHHDSLCLLVFDHTPIAHPTAFIRKSFLDKYNIRYDSSYPNAEDFQLWTRIILHKGKLGNLQKVLLDYRLHENQISSVKRQAQENITSVIRAEYLSGYYKCLSLHKASNVVKLFNIDKVSNQETLDAIKILLDLANENKIFMHFENKEFDIILQNLYIRLIHRCDSGFFILKILIEKYHLLYFLRSRHKIKSLKLGFKKMIQKSDF